MYVAGKISKNSVFGTHHWRDDFLRDLAQLSGIALTNIDPTKTGVDQGDPFAAFGADAFMISRSDMVIVYLSDDISVGGSQEILIAKYFQKPVFGLAPLGGKFNGSTKEYFGKNVENYRDPFVFSTCDAVCADMPALAAALQNLSALQPKGIGLIDDYRQAFEREHLEHNEYLKQLTQ